jgi:hypothetical protein
MAAPKGNRFWEARTKHGRDLIFASPEILWDACVEYFEWAADNPLYEYRLVSYQGESKVEPVPKLRAMTIGGLCIFLGIDRRSWDDYRKREGFSQVVQAAEQVIREQKFTGAAADLLNPNIIARDLGLADKSELTGRDGAPLMPEASETEIARRIALVLAKAVKAQDSGA